MKCVFGMLIVACTGPPPRGPAQDASGSADASTDEKPIADAALPEVDGGVACLDVGDCAGALCDQGDLRLTCQACTAGRCALCDNAKDCQKLSPTWNACTEDDRCVECTTTEDCADNPQALGTDCDVDLGFCTCASDNDCLGNAHGARCVSQKSGYCGCTSDSDCAMGKVCNTTGGLDTCGSTTNVR